MSFVEEMAIENSWFMIKNKALDGMKNADLSEKTGQQ